MPSDIVFNFILAHLVGIFASGMKMVIRVDHLLFIISVLLILSCCFYFIVNDARNKSFCHIRAVIVLLIASKQLVRIFISFVELSLNPL